MQRFPFEAQRNECLKADAKSTRHTKTNAIERVSRHLQRFIFELFLNYSATRKPHKTQEKVDGERFKMPLRRPTLYPIELPRLVLKILGFYDLGRRFSVRRHPQRHLKRKTTWRQNQRQSQRNLTRNSLYLPTRTANGPRKLRERSGSSAFGRIMTLHSRSISIKWMKFKLVEIPGERVSHWCRLRNSQRTIFAISFSSGSSAVLTPERSPDDISAIT